ncbi:MAG: 6-bladed beta-propeller, partial [Gammaproteobacteria bacterium]|nr:6-bladed beta-propeller [Gammaproteobacteria bacterium]
MTFKLKKSLLAVLWLSLLIAQPLMAELTAEHLLSIKKGLNQPTDTAISSNGDIYILNGVLSRVIVFSKHGNRKFSFGRTGKGNSELNLPMGINIKNQQVFIADTGNARISIYNLQGKFIRHIDLHSSKPENNPVAPVSLLIMENKIIWSDRKNHQLCASNIKNGKTLNCWGGKGEADGQFNYPYQLASDDHGYIFAIDVLNARVQAFS